MQVFVPGVDRVALIFAHGRALYYKVAITFVFDKGDNSEKVKGINVILCHVKGILRGRQT